MSVHRWTPFLGFILVLASALNHPLNSTLPSAVLDAQLIFSAVFDDRTTGDKLYGMDVGPDGSIYLCGANQAGSRENNNAFGKRLEPGGVNVSWSVLFGGSPNPDDAGRFWPNYCDDIAYGSTGVLHVVGITASPDFPIVGGWDPTFNGENDVFYAKLDAATGSMLYSTFLGGSGREGEIFDPLVSATPDGGAVVAFTTPSDDIETIGGVQTALKDGQDPVIYRFDASGIPTAITYFGTDRHFDSVGGLAVDNEGNVFIGAVVASGPTDFPFTNAFQDEFGGGAEAWAAKLTPDLSTILYASPLGGSGADALQNFDVTGNGSLVITGYTNSLDLPAVNAFQPELGGQIDAFVAVVGPSGSLDMLTYLGGDASDFGLGVSTGDDGRIYVTGRTRSDGVFAIDAIQQNPGGLDDVFVQILEPDGQSSLFATYLGGPGGDGTDLDGHGTLIKTLATGDLVVAGPAREGFPVQGFSDEEFDFGFFVARMLVDLPALGGDALAAENDPVVAVAGFRGNPVSVATAVANSGSESVTIQSISVDASSGFAVDAPDTPLTLGPGESLPYTVEFTPPDDLPDAPIESEIEITGTFASSPLSVSVKAVIIRAQLPHGLAIHPDDPTPDVFPPRSDFSGIVVTGSGLSDIDFASIDPPDGITVKSVKADNDGVLIPLAIDHTTELGEREFKLISSTSQYEVDVSDFVTQELFVTSATAGFNQAVDAAKLPEPWKNVLVSDKPGVLRVQLQDPSWFGSDFTGTVTTDAAPDRDEFPGFYLYRSEYSTRDIELGVNYLSLPFGRLVPGDAEFEYTMTASISETMIGGPVLKRESRPSRSLSVHVLRFRITDGQSTHEPASVPEIREAFDYVRAAYPISHDSLRLRILSEPRDLPATLTTADGDVPTWEIVERSDGTVGPILTKAAQSKIPEQINWGMLETETDIVAVFLPNRTADRRDRNGGIKGINGFASFDNGVTVIGRVGGGFGRTTAHEFGHMLGGVFALKVDDPGLSLGDEYEGGVFKCDANPPISGLTDWNDVERCPGSTLVDGRDGDDRGTFTDESSFNTLRLEPVVTNTNIEPPVTRYNIMSGGKPDNISWTDVRSYTELVKSLVPKERHEQGLVATKTTGVEAVVVQGSVFADGTGRISSATVVNRPVVRVHNDGEYRFALTLAGGGVESSSNTFDAEFVSVSEPPAPTDRVDFAVYLPIEGVDRAAYDTIELSRDGSGTIAELPLTTSAPVVSNITGTMAGDGSGDVDLSWEAADEDTDAGSLTYGVFYVGEDGELVFVAAGLSSPEYRWQTVADGPNDDPRVVVIASDGFNEGRAEVDLGFAVGVNAEVEEPGEIPERAVVPSNYPNPFVAKTILEFSLTKPVVAEIHVYDVLGRRVQTTALGRLDAGVQRIELDGARLISGTYFYAIVGEGTRIAGSMTRR